MSRMYMSLFWVVTVRCSASQRRSAETAAIW